MASPRRARPEQDPVVVKLSDGQYDRELAEFRARLDEATEALMRLHEAMRAENTLRS
jgi:hypothetical protein